MERYVVAVIERATDRTGPWQLCNVYQGAPIAGIAQHLKPGHIWSDGWGNHYRKPAEHP